MDDVTSAPLTGGEAEIEAAAEALWQDYVRSTRRAEPRLAWSLEGVPQRRIATPAGEVVTWRVGEGPATLLVHGMADDHTIWTPLMDAMEACGLPFVTLDLPGHGLSDGNRTTLSMAAAAVTAVVDVCGPIEAIVGHSLGGLSTAVALANGLPVDRAVLMAVTRKRLVRLIELAERRGADERVLARMMAIHAERFGDDDLACDIPRLADRISAEILLVHSYDDERVHHEDSAAAHEALANSTLWRMAGPNHRNTAREPVVVDRVLEFLQKFPGRDMNSCDTRIE